MSDYQRPTKPDRSNGYEELATQFITARERAAIGAATVGAWARELPDGASVLDLGCGSGRPITAALVGAGLRVHGVDASPTMIEVFQARFPDASAQCAAVEDVILADHSFDAAVAWGLVFLLEPETQALLIRKVSRALKDGGRFLLTAPAQIGQWVDALTGRTSTSLGRDAYLRLLSEAGFVLLGEAADEGENHYYFARRSAAGPPQGWSR